MFWFLLVIAFLRFQVMFWTIFVLPTQGFFNALIYFNVVTTKQARRGSIPEQTTRSSTDSSSLFRHWESLRRSFSIRRSSAASTDPIATVVVRVTEEDNLQDSEEQKPVPEQTDRNGATEGSQIPSDSVEMELSRTIFEA
jgi:hypothetical protein